MRKTDAKNNVGAGLGPAQRGITLIALIITIILMLILAGVMLNLTIGENGLFETAKYAVKKYELEEIREEVEIRIADIITKETILGNKITIEDVLQKLVENGTFEIIDKESDVGSIDNYDIKLKQNEDGSIIIETIDILGVERVPVITIEDKDTWANQKIVKISKESSCITKYTLDGSRPSKNNGEIYKEPIIVTDNCEIKAIYIMNNKQKQSRISEERIAKIDKNKPKEIEIKVIPGKINVEIEVIKAEDLEATKTDGKSGIAGYRYNCKYNNLDHWSDITTEKSYNYTEVYGDLAGTDCEVVVEVIDNAGNIGQSNIQKIKTTCLNSKYLITEDTSYIGRAGNTTKLDVYRVNAGPCILTRKSWCME